jgi:site-specific DNA-methyltransferase (adenine-specific)
MQTEQKAEQIIITGNNIDSLKNYPDNFFDSIVTDPPYGLGKEPNAQEMLQAWITTGYLEVKGAGFMGKEWDAFVPQPIFWKEVFRVLKHGGHVVSFFGTRTYDWGVMSMRLAGFEVRDCIQWIYGCYSNDTEVLTKDGWKYYSELTETCEILQWESHTNTLTWIKPLNKFEYQIEEKMVLLQNRHTSQLITKNHSVYAKIRKHSRNPKPTQFEKIQAQDIKRHWQIDLPLAGNLLGDVSEPNAYLIGWWLTDAWVHGDKKACMFSQSKIETREKLKQALNSAPCKFSEYVKESKNPNHQSEHTFYVTGEIANFLLENYPTREMNWNMLSWDLDSKVQLIEGLLDGDGSRKRNNSYCEIFWSKKAERLDIFQALCLSVNIRSHIDYKKGCVYINREHSTTQIQNKHSQEQQDYKGMVWCLETETGAFVVRRNGKAFISGNSGFPKSHNISIALDKMQGAEREVVGTGKAGKGFNKVKGFGTNTTKSDEYTSEWDVTTASTDQAKQWEGWGSALKPANEPIVLARKPLEKGLSIAENVLKWGVGAINIDASRIGHNEEQKFTNREQRKEGWNMGNCGFDSTNNHTASADPNGRFPSNVILTHHSECECLGLKKVKGSSCSPEDVGKGREGNHSNGIYGEKSSKITVSHTDENGEETIENWNCHEDCPIKILDEQSGELKSGNLSGKEYTEGKRTNVVYGKLGAYEFNPRKGDTGGASRFFYVAKASKSERNFGLKGFEEKQSVGGGGGIGEYLEDVNSPSGKYGSEKAPSKNHHPTVKPVKLMQYLVRMITPPNGTVLDPFAGSGTTGVACKIDGFNFVGLELSEEYGEIARARIEKFVEEREFIDDCKIFESEKNKIESQYRLFE